MKAYIHRLETLLPPHSETQEALARLLGKWSADPVKARVIRHVFHRSGIDRRHSVLADFIDPDRAGLFKTDSAGRLSEPSTQQRNRCFIQHAAPMAVEIAGRLVDGSAGFTRADVTHLITVSCTGFMNPGIDLQIVTELGLAPSVERYNLGFMGCYAAMPALRMAQQFCQARPEAVVLVVCVELCSLHMQMKTDADSILANALFSDGAGAALVSALPPAGDRPVLALDRFMSALAPEGKRDMAWEIGDNGFNIVLSAYVPDVIAANVERIVDELLAPTGMEPNDVQLWAVHPGGRSILDKVEQSLGLAAWQIQPSREVLRDCGNMSSVTILFVLKRMLAAARQSASVAAMAFGPGLTVEGAVLELVPPRVSPKVVVSEEEPGMVAA